MYATARLVGWSGDVVGVALAVLQIGIEQPGQFVLVEAQPDEVELRSLQVGQFERQQIEVPGGDVGRLVVGDPVRLDLRRRQVLGDVHRNLGHPQPLGRLPPRVADDDRVLFVDDDRLAEPELLQGTGDGFDGVVVEPGVLLVGPDPFDGPHRNAHGSLS